MIMSHAIPTIITRLKNLPNDHFIELLTFKKDRSIKIVKINDRELLIIEKGYAEQEHHVPFTKIKKTLKSLIKKEFPRSNKAHLHSGKHPQQ